MYCKIMPITVTMRSQAQVCGLSISVIACSKPAEGMDIYLLCLLCVVYVAGSGTSWSLVQRIFTGWVSNFVWVRNLNNEVV